MWAPPCFKRHAGSMLSNRMRWLLWIIRKKDNPELTNLYGHRHSSPLVLGKAFCRRDNGFGHAMRNRLTAERS